MTKYIAIGLLALTSCVAEEYYDQDEFPLPVGEEAEIEAEIEEIDNGPYGSTWNPSCDFLIPKLDPRWSPAERAAIKRAARQWVDATGVELGSFAIAKYPCIPGTTEACVAFGESSQPMIVRNRYSGVVLYRDRIAAGGYDLETVALHELGHYIGISTHVTAVCTDQYVMAACGDLPATLTVQDVTLWRLTCDHHDSATYPEL